MLPRRRYRLLLFVAALIVFLFYRATHYSDWDPSEYTRIGKQQQHYPSHFDSDRNPLYKPPSHGAQGEPVKGEPHPPHPPPPPQHEEEAPVKIPTLKPGDQDDGGFGLPTAAAPLDSASSTSSAAEPSVTTPVPWYEIIAPGLHTTPESVSTSTYYPRWQKFQEQFPVAAEDLILLPTGTPKPIPRIQFDFPQEKPAAKEKREARLAEIKAEMVRAWSGYRTYAWMHDELAPVNKFYRDPFCGWAATLVDSLDTLWIMGMREEFDEAAHAVKNIDFTYSTQRHDIPVFETVIRYLGGLLAAYDVSGGHEGRYKMLLDKAEELADILYGAFDTPNRMPVLYYLWRPESVMQPRRATIVNVAEVGSLLMEFTHLAQLTGKEKYYDAVARITDAFEGLQRNGTAIQGIFPEMLDAGGCNRTATELQRQAALQAQNELNGVSGSPGAAAPAGAAAWPRNPPKLEIINVGDTVFGTSFAGPSSPDEGENGEVKNTSDNTASESPAAAGLAKRGFREANAANDNVARDDGDDDDGDGVAIPVNGFNPWSAAHMIDLDCVTQPPLVPTTYGYQSYSMGGSQDSTYEYFPKTYLLLGGLEPKYRNMHEKTVAAIKKWLLYRPMTKDGRDILFSAKLTTTGVPEVDAQREFEVTHLTCFLGGMFGLGAKIFNSDQDLEIAQKLTDGCVWAYESTPSGIMPEGSTVVPCASFKECPWNETAWYQALDPMWEYRDQQVKDYFENKKAMEAHQKLVESQQEIQRMREEQQQAQSPGDDALIDEERPTVPPPPGALEEETSREKTMYEIEVENSGDAAPKMAEEPAKPGETYRYPRPEPGAPKKEVRKKRNDRAETTRWRDTDEDGQDFDVAERPTSTVDSAGAEPGSSVGSSADSGAGGGQIPLEDEDPNKPPTHLEFVKSKIANEKIPPGFVRIPHRHYILRPEAIESVWYMYRITGNPEWMEKGWRMWKSIIEAVRTDVGHSAIMDVMMDKSPQKDSMESFWIAETLKYFYLLFATPDTISLDEWVLNTEAHPFRRPKGKIV